MKSFLNQTSLLQLYFLVPADHFSLLLFAVHNPFLPALELMAPISFQDPC